MIRFIIIVMFLSIPSIGLSSPCDKGDMLQWKYGPFDPPYTFRVRNNATIEEWNHATVSKPDTAQIAVDCVEYISSFKLRDDKKRDIKKEGLRRVQIIDDSIKSLGEAIRYAKNLSRWDGIGVSLTANELAIKNIALAGKDAIAFIIGATDAEVTDYNVVDDPNWTQE